MFAVATSGSLVAKAISTCDLLGLGADAVPSRGGSLRTAASATSPSLRAFHWLRVLGGQAGLATVAWLSDDMAAARRRTILR